MDAIIYTDGHGTKVTTHEFVTSDSKYLIQGIVDARINQVQTSLVPAVFCLLFGVLAAGLGVFNLLDNRVLDFSIGPMYMTANRISGMIGFIFICAGIVGLMWRNKKYSVHITTAEGERDPLVSSKKDYVRQVVLAIRNAVKHVRR